MASSQSFRKGQFPIVCQLCEVDMKLKWKCHDCDLLMCDRCREKVHPKFKRANEHKIVDLKQVGTCTKDLEHDSLDFLAVKCEKHTEQDCCLFCQTCEQLICPSCVTKTHKAHDLVEILEACEVNKTRLTEEKEMLETKLLELDEIEARVGQVEDVEKSRYEKTRQEICDQKRAVKNEVDRYTDKLLEKLDDNRTIVSKSLNAEKESVSKIREVLSQRLTLTCSALDQRDGIKMLKQGDRVWKSVDQTDEQPFYLETISIQKFIPSNYHNVDKYFGFLQNTVASQTAKTMFKINRQFTTSINIENLNWLVVYTNDLWIGQNSWPVGMLQRVTPKKDKLQVIWSLEIDIFGLTLCSKDDLLLCVDESRLKKVDGGTGEMSDSIYDVSPLVTRSVHVTSDNQIVIAAKNKGKPFPVSGRRVVITMNKKGKQTTVFEYDRNGVRLFTYPERITSNSKGFIFVSDILSDGGQGRIVVLEHGQEDPLYVYSGCSEANSKQIPFQPVGLVNTPSNNVIVSDLNTNTLHILNCEGHLISLFNLLDIGVVYRPYSLAMGSSGLLYLGCVGDSQGDSEAAHLYELKYSGC